jgi:hypothetical protein
MSGRPDVRADANTFKDGGIRGERDRVVVRESMALFRDLAGVIALCERLTCICMELRRCSPITL